ncbi:MAG: hypothetical protein ACJA0N_000332 [Pseudohongiellaceae bacterium]|jgi:hypothetical protein
MDRINMLGHFQNDYFIGQPITHGGYNRMKLILAVCFLVTALPISAAESNVKKMTTPEIQAAEKKGVGYYKTGAVCGQRTRYRACLAGRG